MNRRLPSRPGEWIDRSRPIDFRFEGRPYRGYHGDVLSSALWANGERMLGRSFKYHRPRGIYSLAGHDVNAMVEDGVRTNLRGDLLPIEPGLDVRAVNTVAGLRRDRLRITERFSAFLPVGFYYKAFHTPRCLFRFYENQMRKVAGLGRINPFHEPAPSPKDYAFCDLLVVGAGPAGLAAATAAAEQGARVLVADEQPRPGGSLNWQWAAVPEAQGHRQELLTKVTALANLELRCSTQAAGCYADHWVALVDPRRLTKLRASALLVASGCFEQPAVFGNNDLPGVMLGSAAQRLIHLYAVKPFDRCVVLAANSHGYRLALELHEAGVVVAAVADLRPAGEPTALAADLSRAGIDVYKGHTVYEAVPGSGKTHLTAAVLCPLGSNGQPESGSMTPVDCDGIAVSVGWTPAGGLLYQAGARFEYSQGLEQLVPQTLGAGVFAAGCLTGVFDLEDQIADGRRAGLAAAKYLGRYDGPLPPAPAPGGSPPSHAYPIFEHKKKKNFVDFDEDLHLADFVNAHQEGYDNIELLKRYTTVGMGPSQGKLANANAVRILARLNGRSINQTGTTTSRPFHQPVSLSHLAGRRFHPMHRTPMHHWHAKAGAVFFHAGQWYRPEYYARDGKSREDCILEEAQSVRQNLGMIDVGTLGKFLVCGPDAVELLGRIYTGRFAKQPIGRLRYGLALDESGVIIEDGVIARAADDRFYVTATSSGAAAFFRQMQRWAIIWRLEVMLSDITGQLAAMNLAGPRSRELLAPLTDVDLSPAAFGYLGARDGKVAGVPATLLRVGFVGELGYEIHVPAPYGTHVWTQLLDAGAPVGIRPFGVEAQRLLRLEKGHIIVGQDTDALTTPDEAQCGWAIGKHKPFFIGQRSLGILRRQTLARRLVGIALRADHGGPRPEECHLIFKDGRMAGRITSIGHRSTRGYPLGMALVEPDLAEPGTKVQARVHGGAMVEAEVVLLPHYDRDNERQNE